MNYVEIVADGLKKHCEYWGYDYIEKLKENDSAHNFYKLFCQTTNTYFVNTGSECHDLGGDSDHYNVTFQKKENVAYVKKCGEDFDNRDVDATIGVEDIIKLLV